MGSAKELSRRELFRESFRWLGAVAAGEVAGSIPVAAWWGLSIPEKGAVNKGEEGVFSPGWIESRIEAPFIGLDGHFSFLKEAVLSNPQIRETTQRFFWYLRTNLYQQRRIALGDALSSAIDIGHQIFGFRRLPDIDPRTNLSIESVHAGVYLLAAGFFPHFTPQELGMLGVKLPKDQTVHDFFWGDKGLGTVTFPKLFGVEGKEDLDRKIANLGYAPRYSGQDRATHFASHLLISFIHLYSRHFDLPWHKGILQSLVSFFGGGRAENEARLLSEIIGRVYEVSNLSDFKNLPLPGRDNQDINQGPFEDMVEADYKGNRFGANAAIAIWQRLLQGESIKPVLEELSDEKFSRFETSPTVNSPR